MNVSEDVIEKLKKVLNLANRGATQGEAEAAFRRAKEIAMRYNIDLASIEVGDSKATTKKKAEKSVLSTRSKYEQPYHRWLTHVLQECFTVRFCWSVNSTPGGRVVEGIHIIGAPDEIAICTHLWTWLEELFPRTLSKAVREKRLTYSMADTNGCYAGIARGLVEANKKAEDALNADDKNKYAIVVRSKKDAVDELFNLMFPQTSTLRRSTRAFSDNAAEYGFKEGSKIKLGQMGSSSNSTAQLKG